MHLMMHRYIDAYTKFLSSLSLSLLYRTQIIIVVDTETCVCVPIYTGIVVFITVPGPLGLHTYINVGM